MDTRCCDDAMPRWVAAGTRRGFGQWLAGWGLAGGLGLVSGPEHGFGKRKRRGKRRKRRASTCGGGPCGRCGIAGNPCCAIGGGADDAGRCEAGFRCDSDDRCLPCGNAVGQPCCPVPQSGGVCDAGDRLVCSFRAGDTCVACGAGGEPCCGDGGNGGCDAGHICSSTIPPSGQLFCFPCGAAGQRCCSSGSGCLAGLTCGVSGLCGSCPGGADECQRPRQSREPRAAPVLRGEKIAVDGQRFDDLTQHLASLLSRRRFGRALAAAGLGGVLESAPKAKAKKKKTRCKGGTIRCGRACVNPQTNPSHCGGCNRRCSGGAGCVAGSCQGSCQPPNTVCNGECVDTESDKRFCGGCANACVSGQVCFGGECEDLCQNDFDCISELNPNGLECTSLPGSAVTVCGCRPDPVVPRRPCNGGEPCSTCCSNEECIIRTGNGNMICAGIPPTATILGRSCCLPTGAPCGIGCCGVCGAANTCVGLAEGQNCAINQACASGVCGTTFTCT